MDCYMKHLVEEQMLKMHPPPLLLYWQILIEFCAGGAVDAVMLGKSPQPSSSESEWLP